jgi:ribosomal protein S18 acetylase RimI-like enzyme
MKNPRVRPFEDRDADAVVALSLRAWEPVFESIEKAMGTEIFALLHPDWRVDQRQAVEAALASRRAWVAEVDANTVGFVAVELHHEGGLGEIHMLAVAPEFQNDGVGTALTGFALAWMKKEGMSRWSKPGEIPAMRRRGARTRKPDMRSSR